MEWYYVQDGNSVGPVDEGEFKALASAGKIAPDTLVWHEGMPEWIALDSLSADAQTVDVTTPAPPADAPADSPIDVDPAAAAPADETPAEAPQRSSLQLKRQDSTIADPATTGAATAEGVAAMCCECGREFGVNDMIQYEGSYVCAECKPTFFQRVREGADAVVTGGVGETPNADLTALARQSLSGNWGTAIGATIVYSLIVGAIGFLAQIIGMVIPLGGNVISLLLIPPMQVGRHMFFIDLNRRAECDFALLFNGFSRYGPSIGVYFFMGLFASLPILPGVAVMIPAAIAESETLMVVGGIVIAVGCVFSIIISFMLAMALFILADEQAVGCFDALRQSRAMMRGMKWKLFCLQFRFLGWTLLSLLFTLCIGLLWVTPYLWTATAAFYDDVKGRVAMD